MLFFNLVINWEILIILNHLKINNEFQPSI